MAFSDHVRDAARAEEALTLSFGSELIGMQRDWNEELQSCREFPHTSPQERCNSLFCLLQLCLCFTLFICCLFSSLTFSLSTTATRFVSPGASN